MIKKKICMLGGYAVGKTSLVRRFVHNIFSDKYLSTIGVKIDKKTVLVDGQEINLLLWDIAGEEEAFPIPGSYLRGSAGYLLVVDITRKTTLDQAVEIQQRVRQSIGEIPFVVVLNKIDLVGEWELPEDELEELQQGGWQVLQTSAKVGTGVEEVFNTLTRKIISAT